MPVVLVAPDKFKGSLTAAQVVAAISNGLLAADPTLTVRALPLADGGEGTVEAAIAAGWTRRQVTVSGPTGLQTTASYALDHDRGLIEVATAAGLALVADAPAPLTASSRGVGELVLDAIGQNCRSIILALGGSATTDGGAGMLCALGARVPDRGGAQVGDGGAALRDAARLDLSELDPRLASIEFILASDVDNPLCGPDGAATVFAPQKGASRSDVRVLERGLKRWADVVTAAVGTDRRDEAGAGAAGGIGFGAMSVLGAQQQSGADYVLNVMDFDRALAGADLVVTGEGSLDAQSLRGKLPIRVAERAHARGVPVVAVVGRTELTGSELESLPFARVFPLSELEPELSASVESAAPLLQLVGVQIARELL